MSLRENYALHAHKLHVRVSVYGIIGAIALMCNYSVNEMFLTVGLSLSAASGLAYVTAGHVNFFLHKTVTWGDIHPGMSGWHLHYPLFVLGNLIGMVVNLIALHFYQQLSVPAILVHYAAVFTAFPFNFWWNHKVTFKIRDQKPPKPREKRHKPTM